VNLYHLIHRRLRTLKDPDLTIVWVLDLRLHHTSCIRMRPIRKCTCQKWRIWMHRISVIFLLLRYHLQLHLTANLHPFNSSSNNNLNKGKE